MRNSRSGWAPRKFTCKSPEWNDEPHDTAQMGRVSRLCGVRANAFLSAVLMQRLPVAAFHIYAGFGQMGSGVNPVIIAAPNT